MHALISFALLACMAGPNTTPDVSPAPDASTPTPTPAPAVSQMTLTLDPDELRYDEAAGTATFSPGSSVRSAQYTHYILDLQSLESVLGGRPTGPVAVIVEITGEEDRTHTPDDPREQQPVGGFQITERIGRVVSRAP